MSQQYTSNRQRSRERNQTFREYSQSSQDSYRKRRKSQKFEKSQFKQDNIKVEKRVVFNEELDVKVFRKDDEPCSKGLSQQELQEFVRKLELETGVGKIGKINWEKIKHIEAQLQQNSIKQEKEQQKILNENLEKIVSEIQFYPPIGLVRDKESKLTPDGSRSIERDILTARLNDVLGCFYVHQNQIPADPAFQLQNTSPSSQTKNINFNKIVSPFCSHQPSKDIKLPKGILKTTSSEPIPETVDPHLIFLIKQITNNSHKFSKDQLETLLTPYKATGQLAYIFSNKQLLKEILSSNSQSNDDQVPNSSFSTQPRNSSSHERDKNIEIQPQFENYHENKNESNMHHSYSINQFAMMNNHNPHKFQQQYSNQIGYNIQQGNWKYHPYSQQCQVPNRFKQQNIDINQIEQNYPSSFQTNSIPNRNYKTVPCKYFHSPQGCLKADKCTFIHEQEYAGQLPPNIFQKGWGIIPVNTIQNQKPPDSHVYPSKS